MPEEDGSRGGEATAHQNLAGDVLGRLVQAGVIHGGVHVHSEPTAPSAPTLFPAPVAPFVNRDAELHRVGRTGERARHERRTGIAVLHGLSGLGKTALALHFGHTAHASPDVDRLYASLARRADGTRPSTSDILAGFLRHYRVPPDAVPALLEERAALFRSITAQRRVIVFIDDADSAAQVRDLIPNSPGGVVIVTTRRQLRSLDLDPGADFVPVRPLSDAASAELIARMARRDHPDPTLWAPDPAALRRIVDHCAGVPVALRIVGSYLYLNPAVPLTEVADRLADARGRLDEFSPLTDSEDAAAVRTPRGICDLVYDELPPLEARLYRLGGLVPGPTLSNGVAAALLGLPSDSPEAAHALRVLADHHLIEQVGDGRRYRYSELTRRDARARAELADPVPEREAAMVRMVLWYTAAAASADDTALGRPLRLRERLPVPGLPRSPAVVFRGKPDALEWLRAERNNLHAVIELAAGIGQHAAVVRLCGSAWALYDSDKLYVDAQAAYTTAVESAELLGHHGAEALMRDHLARVHTDLGAGALRAARNTAAPDGGGRSGHAADAAYHRELAEREFRAAAEQFALAREAAARSDSPLDLAVVLDGEHRLHRERGHFAAAAGNLRKVIELHRAAGNDRGVALNSYQLGRVHLLAGEPVLAREMLEAALAVDADAKLHARARVVLARVLAELGEDTAALGAVESALTVFGESGQSVRFAEALEVRADLALRAGDRTAWRAALTAAERLYADVHHPGADRVRARLGSSGD
ncbi:NB-ARC domain-containing protein [Marinactinospora rubrisoli]|uniref:NB-ARC domain-containing protein n=1 Tax=Marinactinospora rubrisoli TaxID=2715399 RepID=A0ABW2K9Y9_9ACTN